ncbi:type II toxin-antitoxin system MqsA family antitoxin [Desulfallas sp. Bu1-1]|uniref:type II toxin-antitoxin system MqsA family antitoxin n=1 Tax=Desulfallas sp. Bu1-1 TaxID=2787620 RepID=UPI00189EEE20|nr:type II toxin-antitoxin system MqsA family antitoxin [Desulfallas sp. Bu1-1]MBF7081572.1 type II toxin-antitoxin system MqsA family antitoxin [Desulfallas sp. Bu1-1]
MVTRCFQCGSSTVRKLIIAENWWGDTLTLVENVPAWVCERCGEQYFDSDVIKELDKMKDRPPKARRVIKVPVYGYGQL